jgi:hypothetical protein
MTIPVNTETSFSPNPCCKFRERGFTKGGRKKKRRSAKRIKFPVLLYLVSDVLSLKESPFKLKKVFFNTN